MSSRLLTALSSPKFPRLAKWADKLAFDDPAHTPHNDRRTLENDKTTTLTGLGNAGDRQSRTIAVSLRISAASLYILHSGSSDVPSLCAKRMVAILPMDSCSTESSSAAVGDALASPTPTPIVPPVSSYLASKYDIQVVSILREYFRSLEGAACGHMLC